MVSLIQDFEADFPQEFGLKILNSGIILETFTHVRWMTPPWHFLKSLFICMHLLTVKTQMVFT